MGTLKWLFFLALVPLSFLLSQEELIINGFISDAETGEALIGANVYIEGKNIGASTNQYGYYSISLKPGEYKIHCNYMGYKEKITAIQLTGKERLNIELVPQALSTEAIEVIGEAVDENVSAPEMSVVTVNPTEIKSVPIIFGEQDVLKTIQLLPGVTAGSEGSSGFQVRGGGMDQNLILLDEAPVYNAAHFLGFFSVFNSDAINSAKLTKGGGPPEYGGRLSSVFDIKMKEGNKKQMSFNGGIGLISSRLGIEGPINGGKGSYYISARRTYADLVMKLVDPDTYDDLTLYFYDLNLKANYQISDKDFIYLSAYLGRDELGFEDRFGIDWGNTTTTLRWNHIYNDNLFSNTSLIYSNFDYVISFENGDGIIDITSGIEDINLKQSYNWYLNQKHQLNFGLDINYHTFIPGEISSSGETSINNFAIDNKKAIEAAVYLGHEWNINTTFSLNYGLRYSHFSLIGPGAYYNFDDDGNAINEKEYESNEIIKSYGGLEPRFSAKAMIDRYSSVKLSLSRNQQFIHLVSNSGGGSALDVWHPSTNNIKPSMADQIALGYFRNFDDNRIESSVEVYYKKLYDIVDFKNGADLLFNPYLESQFVFGEGTAYGLELLLKKKQGKFTGWLAYTLARSERSFPEIDNGDTFVNVNDRTHDFSLVAMYNFTEKWNFSANWIYYTGLAATYPSGKYNIDGETINYYTSRNGHRWPDSHRLDLSVTYHFNKRGRYESSLNFSVYNSYGNKNPYSIRFRENEDNPEQTEAVKVYLFTYFPSISYNFKW
jgi:hypothetical protein